MNKKRILIFGWADSVHIHRWTAGLKSRGFELKLVSLGGQKLEEIETIILPGSGSFGYLKNRSEAASQAREFKPDLVHVHYAGGFGLWGLATKLQPLLVSVWGADVMDLPNSFVNRMIIKKTLRRATCVTATSRLLKTVTIKLEPSVADKISVIPFGVELKELIGFPSGTEFKICFIKAHRRKYGLEYLIRALAKIRTEIPEVRLSVAGEGELTDEYKAMTQSLGLSDIVSFVGFVDNCRMHEFISEHHLMCMPSVMDSESFGVAVLEASAAARAVIASDVGGVPEVLIDGETGFLVPRADVDSLSEGILKLAKDEQLLQKYGVNGRRFVEENYSWEKSLDMMAELYERLIYDKKNS